MANSMNCDLVFYDCRLKNEGLLPLGYGVNISTLNVVFIHMEAEADRGI